MADENGAGPTVIVVDAGGETQVIDGDGGQVGGSAEVAAVEEVADAAVQIAQIEADRDVAIAELAIVETEVRHETYSNEEAEQWRLTAARLEGENTALLTELERLRTPSTPELSPEPPPNPEPPPEVVAVVAEPEPEGSPAAQAPEPEKRKSKPHKWI